MKFLNFLLFTLFIGITMIQTACTTDPCAKISCQNGGNCESGTCKCPSGYYGTNCEKSEVCRINSYTEKISSGSPTTYTLTYDAFGRVVTSVTNSRTQVYTYSAGQINSQETYTSSSDYYKQKFLINAKGYPTVEYDESSFQGVISKDTTFYHYDANDYYTGFTKTGYSLTYTYANGNRVSSIYVRNGQTLYTGIYEYYTDKARSSVYDSQFPDKYGVKERNMRKKYTKNYTDGTKIATDYSYEYNVKGAVTQQIGLVTSSSASGVVTSTTTELKNFDISCLQP